MYIQLKNQLNNQIENLIIRTTDGACIPFDPDNTDYQAYLKFIEDGGIPLPAEEQA
jgi:hypothetical protein